MKKNILSIALMVVGLILLILSFMGIGKGGNLEIKIDEAPLIMPAAHKVYANPDALDGQYYLFKAKITNTGSGTLEDVVVRYEVPG